jgi:hypothetical protein
VKSRCILAKGQCAYLLLGLVHDFSFSFIVCVLPLSFSLCPTDFGEKIFHGKNNKESSIQIDDYRIL